MTYLWQDCAIAMFPHFIMPFRIPHLSVLFTPTDLAGSHFTTRNGMCPWDILCSLPQAFANLSESLCHTLPCGVEEEIILVIFIYFLLKLYYSICPLTSSLSWRQGFLIFTFIYFFLSPFAYPLGYRHLSKARHGCTTKLKSFRSHLVQALYKALYLILIFFLYFLKRGPHTLCKCPVYKCWVHSWVRLMWRPIAFAAGLNIWMIFCIVLMAWQLTVWSLPYHWNDQKHES